MSQARLLLVARRTSEFPPLRDLLANLKDIRIVGDAVGLYEAVQKTEALEPDLALVSSDLTLEPEFGAITNVFAAVDTRWIEFATPNTACGQPTATPGKASGLFRLSPAEGRSLALSEIRAILNQPRHRRAAIAAAPGHGGPSVAQGRQKLVMIGSSTGGVEALMTILSSYPADCPPTTIVQHTGSGFGESLARLLDRSCAAEVVPASESLPIRAGRVILAAGCSAHMQLTVVPPVAVRLRAGPPISGHCPSVDAMFFSALPLGQRVIGVLLTGMGADGADGMMQLRRAGAHTLAQDEASSLVYGMPKAAYTTGAVITQMHIDKIGPEILRLARADATIPGKAV